MQVLDNKVAVGEDRLFEVRISSNDDVASNFNMIAMALSACSYCMLTVFYGYQVDVDTMSHYPLYWFGAVYEVRRGTWFMAPDGKSYVPCEQNLARQIEDGYKYAAVDFTLRWHSLSLSDTN